MDNLTVGVSRGVHVVSESSGQPPVGVSRGLPNVCRELPEHVMWIMCCGEQHVWCGVLPTWCGDMVWSTTDTCVVWIT